MNYSVWNYAKGAYDYYEAPSSQSDYHAPAPKHLGSSKAGIAPEDAAWPLPANARLVGSGQYPVGHIASTGVSRGLGLIPDLSTTNLIVYGALGYFAWKWWQGRK